MPSRSSLAATLLAVFLSLFPFGAAQAQGSTADARVIVKLKPESPLLRKQALAVEQAHANRVDALGKRLGLTLKPGHDMAERMMMVKASGLSSQQLADRLAQQTDVEYAVPDRLRRVMATPNDQYFSQGGANGPAVGQWYLHAPDTTLVSAINATAAWDVTRGDPSMVVAVLDTGVRFDHPDLSGKLLPGYDMIHDAAVSNKGGLTRNADASDPGDWVTTAEVNQVGGQFYHCTTPDSSGNYSGENSSWHGTQVSGIVGALTNNGTGMAGTGWNVKVLPVRVLGKCGGYDSDIFDGMMWAAGISVSGVPANPNPARVVNLSLGGTGTCSQPYVDAVNQLAAKNVVVVASAGNDAGHAVVEPANCSGVIGVAGLRHTGTKVGYSDIGPEVAISAPGGNCVNLSDACLYPILTTTNAGTTTPTTNTYSDGINPSLGTSFSAPLASGTVALMLSVNPSLTPAQVLQKLKGSARAFPTSGGTAGTPVCSAPTSTDQNECYCTTSTCGAGMLDAGAAVVAAAGVAAKISVSPAQPQPNQAVTLDGSGSFVASGRQITSYTWTLVDGGGIVSALPASASTSSISVTPTAAGQFTVSLKVTDSVGGASTVSQTVAVTSPTPPSSGGGGALGWPYLLALLLAVLAAKAVQAPPARRRG